MLDIIKKFKTRLSIRAKILVMFLSLALLLIFTVSFIDFTYIRANIESRILSDLSNLAGAKKAHIRLLIREDVEDVLNLATRFRIREYLQGAGSETARSSELRNKLLATIRNMRETVPVFKGVDFIGVDGKVILSTMIPQNTGGDFSRDLMFLNGRQGVYIGDPYMDEGVLAYDIVAPVFSADGKDFIGVVRVKIDATRLYNIISDYNNLGRTGDIALAKRIGDKMVFFGPIRFHKGMEGLSVPVNSRLARPMSLALTGASGMAIGFDYQGIEVLSAYTYIPMTHWGLVVKISTQEAFEPIIDIRTQLVLFGSALFLMSVLAINALARYITRPIVRLREGTEEIATGNLDFHVTVHSTDEIGDLADHFNIMTERLKKITVSHDRLDREVVERKKAEEQLREALQVKTTFTAMVSHELRTPLAAIKEGINIVFDGVLGPVNNEQKDFLSRARTSVDRLTRLINDILDFQKLESGKMKFTISEHNMKNAINDVCALMRPLAEQKELAITVIADNDLPRVRFDRDKITQVLSNLLSNAIKFTDEGGVTVIAAKEEGDVHIIVRDSGKGIRQKDMRRLFTSFEQLEKAVESKGGTGLGLAISKEIVSRHNGKIWAESEFGKGTAIHFTLPV